MGELVDVELESLLAGTAIPLFLEVVELVLKEPDLLPPLRAMVDCIQQSATQHTKNYLEGFQRVEFPFNVWCAPARW